MDGMNVLFLFVIQVYRLHFYEMMKLNLLDLAWSFFFSFFCFFLYSPELLL